MGLGGCLSPLSPPAYPHPVFSRAACKSSQRAEGPSCLPLPPPTASSTVPFIKSSLPVSRPSSEPGATISALHSSLPLLAPHRVQAESYTERHSPFSAPVQDCLRPIRLTGKFPREQILKIIQRAVLFIPKHLCAPDKD